MASKLAHRYNWKVRLKGQIVCRCRLCHVTMRGYVVEETLLSVACRTPVMCIDRAKWPGLSKLYQGALTFIFEMWSYSWFLWLVKWPIKLVISYFLCRFVFDKIFEFDFQLTSILNTSLMLESPSWSSCTNQFVQKHRVINSKLDHVTS